MRPTRAEPDGEDPPRVSASRRRSRRRLAAAAALLVVAAWCIGVELFQLTGIRARRARIPPAMLVLGTVFDARDLIVYLVTIAALAALDTASRRRRTRLARARVGRLR